MKIDLLDDGERGIIFVLNRKVRLRTHHKGPDREQKYSSTLSLSLASGGDPRTPATLPPRKRPGTHYAKGWVGPRDGLNRRGKSRLNQDSITELSIQ